MPLYLSQITNNGAIRIIRGGYRLVLSRQQRGQVTGRQRSPDRDPGTRPHCQRLPRRQLSAKADHPWSPAQILGSPITVRSTSLRQGYGSAGEQGQNRK